ncbi:IS256 family transposase [Virgibacillus sp. 179-BFC.A HS]|uniref:Mutator family transposase n=1 Tax=Tigheibacillus jepli TaxID=3035914 RepID=A0ABU5CGS6_9BACI|nr:IS256 family transposase [Virgibacillus sp. 179-BFC.A HS]MDY0404402.1 IS256 family transposase [Virgibacillus sp. 179-BFC.A HS]MDY0405044.1 IS256 family transposase [Virgibacillus sp. 179-BFC.A HS]MDY0406555.1 IS256 family transposase [Virgibacillus sp. 179-BFC.A HS]
MTQLNFTLDFEKLKEGIMQSSLNDVLKSTIVIILNKYMERERDLYMMNESHDRDAERHDYRNGYYPRDFVLNIGKIKLKVPRTRSGNFSTDVFEKYKRNDQAFLLSMIEMVVNGVSTRKVTKVVEQLCGESVSKSMVSDLTKQLEPAVQEWANRPLNNQYYRYLYVDAMYIKVREYHKVVSKAVYVAMGVNTENKREIIGFQIANQESKENWSTFFKSLMKRGLQLPKLVISDAHEGLKAAIQEEFLGTSWQRCTVHFLRNIMETMPRKNTAEARRHLKEIFKAPTVEISRALKDEFIEKYEGDRRFEKVIKTLDEGYEDAIQFYAEPANTHKHIRTTNTLERLNSEIRRRERVIRIFPNEDSAFRLIGAVLMDLDENLDKGNKRFIYGQNQ